MKIIRNKHRNVWNLKLNRESGLSVRHGNLVIGGIPFQSIVEKFNTPVWIFLIDKVKENAESDKRAEAIDVSVIAKDKRYFS